MVEVRYRPYEPSLAVAGHAGAGAMGRDLVCAAVSALVLTMLENLPGYAKSGQARFSGGRRELYEVFWRGFLVLEEICPANVRCERIEKIKEERYGREETAVVR